MKMDEPLLSVIVPVYNAEQYIEKCVESILRQQYLNLEIVLVDDGSTDRSGFLCDLLSRKNKCIKVVHTENGGITKARFVGTNISNGKWITFVDADDWIAEDAYRDIIGESTCDIVITGICKYINTAWEIRQPPYFKEGIYDKESIDKKIFPIMLWASELGHWALDPSLCTKIFKRELIIEYLEKALKVGSNYGEDSIVIYPMMLKVSCVRVSKKIYYYHRQRAEGVIPPYIEDEKFFLKLYKVCRYIEREFKKSKYWNLIKKQLDCFYINGVEMKRCCFHYPTLDFAIYFPIDKIAKGSKVVLYGAGKVGKEYWKQNQEYHFCKIVSWVDKKYEKLQDDNDVIQNPEVIRDAYFDYVLIAVDEYYAAKEIACYLKELEVEKEKIVWHSVRINDKGFEDIFEDD